MWVTHFFQKSMAVLLGGKGVMSHGWKSGKVCFLPVTSRRKVSSSMDGSYITMRVFGNDESFWQLTILDWFKVIFVTTRLYKSPLNQYLGNMLLFSSKHLMQIQAIQWYPWNQNEWKQLPDRAEFAWSLFWKWPKVSPAFLKFRHLAIVASLLNMQTGAPHCAEDVIHKCTPWHWPKRYCFFWNMWTEL